MSIDFETQGSVALITINRPEAMNALDPDHHEALGRAFVQFEEDGDLRVAVITGKGDKAFSAGADLKLLIPAFRSEVRSGATPDWNFGGFTAVRGTKPKIAAVNGHALAGGLEMALACDIRVASTNATFGLAETKWAIIPGAGGTVRLPRAVPLGLAMEMILTGEPISAEDAWRTGLVNRVVAPDALLDEALRIASSIAVRGPVAVRAARESILDALGRPESQALRTEYQHFLEVMRTDDAVEGATAFTEKRDPVYTGR